MTTGEKLQNLRKKNNYTQEDLADIMSVSRQSISKWESDVAFPETEKIITLAKLYNCSIDYLLKEDDDDPRPVEMIRKRKYTVKRLPLVLTTGGTYILFLMLCFLPWFGGIYTRTDSVYFYNTAIEHVMHICHLGCVKTAQIQICKAAAAVEHESHIRHVRSVKVT